ncbi:hypothetical protein ACFY5F_00800 [Streptomyces sp. NPDC013161]|uniref:hypothetical protein n=1 Tax=Streptomyces sp. NPDC013161 TaxID=3364862 RepID=UPI0036A2CDF5
MTSSLYDIAFIRSAVTGVEHLLLFAAPQFIGGLATALGSTVITLVVQKRHKPDAPETGEDNGRS